jgi:hypothetical protein
MKTVEPGFHRDVLAVDPGEALARREVDHLLVAVVGVLADVAAGRHRLRPHGEAVLGLVARLRVEDAAHEAVGRHRLPVGRALLGSEDLDLGWYGRRSWTQISCASSRR